MISIGGSFGNSRLPPYAERVLKKMIARFWLPQNRSLFLIPTMFRLVDYGNEFWKQVAKEVEYLAWVLGKKQE